MADFESGDRKGVARVRRDARNDGDEQLVGYQRTDGATEALRGDGDGPWVEPLGRASSDGTTGLVSVGDGDNQRIAVDEYGRIYTVPSPTDVQKVEGDVAHDAADSNTDNFPVKVGGRAIDGVPSEVAEGDRVNALFTLLGQLGTIPWPIKTDDVELVGGDLAAGGAYTASDVIDVRNYRNISFKFAYDPAAVGGYPQVVILGSSSAAEPGVNDDEWYAPPSTDGSVTAEVITGAFPAGTDVTITPEWGVQTIYGLVWRPAAADNVDDEIRQAVEVVLGGFKWLHILYAEVGDPDNRGDLTVLYNLWN